MVRILKNSIPLLNVLENECEICEKYLEILNVKKNVLVTGDIKKLDELVLHEQSFIMKMESLERKRASLLEEDMLSGHTFAEVLELIKSDENSEKFKELYIKLSNILEKLKKANSLNQRLLKERLSVISRLTGNDEI